VGTTSADIVREVVVTVTVSEEAVVALTATLVGDTEQAVPVGAQVIEQESAACPLHPAPPIALRIFS